MILNAFSMSYMLQYIAHVPVCAGKHAGASCYHATRATTTYSDCAAQAVKHSIPADFQLSLLAKPIYSLKGIECDQPDAGQ